MALEVRKNKFAKDYENKYFRELAQKLIPVFEELKFHGLLIGSPECIKNQYLKIDILLVTNSTITIIDLKKYGGNLKLPEHGKGRWHKKNSEGKPQLTTPDTWNDGLWELQVNDKDSVIVQGGRSKSPFIQMFKQGERFHSVIKDNVIPLLNEQENYQPAELKKVVCFQREIEITGKIDPRVSYTFFIADKRSIVYTIKDIIDVTTDEWNGKVKGNKFSDNGFEAIKKFFLADSFDPFQQIELFAEPEETDFPPIDIFKKDELFQEEFEKHLSTINQFFKDDQNILILNGDITSFSFEFVDKLVTTFLTRKAKSENDLEELIETEVRYFAPTNRNVLDIIRKGAPSVTQSLYGKLFDFEHSSMELLSNSINEREVFPLQENNDPEEILYVIFCAHLVYDFESEDEDALVKFGSGSLCNDTVTYLSLNNRNNKLILVSDPFFYGFRANTIASKTFLEKNKLTCQIIDLESRPTSTNDINIANLVHNIRTEIYNHLSFKGNENIGYIPKNEFTEQLRSLIKQNDINQKIILTRDKYEAIEKNKWVREEKGIAEKEIQEGDVILIKNRALVPEIRDPFALPKLVNSGDIAEIKKVWERYSFKSSKYKFKYDIKITKCTGYLKEYDSERILYLSSNAISDIDNFNELNKHKQIRLREIVNEYLEKTNIKLDDILDPFEFKEFNKELESIEKSGALFKGTEVQRDEEGYSQASKKLETRWKINKKKENYVKRELLKEIDSEYFKISQSVNYLFGWALNLKTIYGYRLHDSYLPEYPQPVNNIERFHGYLYSAFSISNKLNVQSLTSINPWFWLDVNVNLEAIPQKKRNVLVKIENRDLDARDRKIMMDLKLENEDYHLVIFCRWFLDQFDPEDDIIIDRIDSFQYQVRCVIKSSNETCEVQFYYNNKWEFKYPVINQNSIIGELICERLSQLTTEPYPFIGEKGWNILEYEKLNNNLIESQNYICDIKPYNFKDRIFCAGNDGQCLFDLTYNGKYFYTYLDFLEKTDNKIIQAVVSAIEILKYD